MNMKMLKVAIAGLFLSVSGFANAGLIDINSGNYWGTTGGVSSGRGIAFEALDDFSISSIGIEAALNAQTFEVVIWSSTNGHQVNSILHSGSQAFGDTLLGWNDIAIDFTFDLGSFYAVQWRPLSSNSSWADSLVYYNDSSLPKIIDGKFNLIDGFAGHNASSFSNFLHPSLRVNINSTDIPEPSTIAIFALSIMGLTTRKFKKR